MEHKPLSSLLPSDLLTLISLASPKRPSKPINLHLTAFIFHQNLLDHTERILLVNPSKDEEGVWWPLVGVHRFSLLSFPGPFSSCSSCSSFEHEGRNEDHIYDDITNNRHNHYNDQYRGTCWHNHNHNHNPNWIPCDNIVKDPQKEVPVARTIEHNIETVLDLPWEELIECAPWEFLISLDYEGDSTHPTIPMRECTERGGGGGKDKESWLLGKCYRLTASSPSPSDVSGYNNTATVTAESCAPPELDFDTTVVREIKWFTQREILDLCHSPGEGDTSNSDGNDNIDSSCSRGEYRTEQQTCREHKGHRGRGETDSKERICEKYYSSILQAFQWTSPANKDSYFGVGRGEDDDTAARSVKTSGNAGILEKGARLSSSGSSSLGFSPTTTSRLGPSSTLDTEMSTTSGALPRSSMQHTDVAIYTPTNNDEKEDEKKEEEDASGDGSADDHSTNDKETARLEQRDTAMQSAIDTGFASELLMLVGMRCPTPPIT